MSWKPLLDNADFEFSTEDLPALIHGEEHSGASLFTITLAALLYHQGEPLLVVSGSEEAKEELMQQTSDADIFSITEKSQLEQAEAHQTIYLTKESESLIPQLLAMLTDKNHRVILIKNIELFSPETLALFYDHPLVIFSGDLNKSEAKESLFQLKYNAKIFFSPLYNDFRLTIPELEEYHGYYQGRISQGVVSARQVNSV